MTFLLDLVAVLREVLPCFWSILSVWGCWGGLALNPAVWRLSRAMCGQSWGCRRIPVLLKGGRLCCHGLWSVPVLCSCLLSCLEMDSDTKEGTRAPQRSHSSNPRKELSFLTARSSHSQQNGPKAVQVFQVWNISLLAFRSVTVSLSGWHCRVFHVFVFRTLARSNREKWEQRLQQAGVSCDDMVGFACKGTVLSVGRRQGKEDSGFSKWRQCSWKRGKDTMQEVQLRIEECVIKRNLGLEVSTN